MSEERESVDGRAVRGRRSVADETLDLAGALLDAEPPVRGNESRTGNRSRSSMERETKQLTGDFELLFDEHLW